jgi:cellulose synthase/poly-beta-1,6-N-acetylglucosamine synthase-like glycosyltransferase
MKESGAGDERSRRAALPSSGGESDGVSTWIVIPAFNEARTIGPIVRTCQAFGRGPIVVDDGSSDETAQVAAAEGALVLRNPDNLGKGVSLWRGMRAALERGEVDRDARRRWPAPAREHCSPTRV